MIRQLIISYEKISVSETAVEMKIGVGSARTITAQQLHCNKMCAL
jgi:hypothetical protein